MIILKMDDNIHKSEALKSDELGLFGVVITSFLALNPREVDSCRPFDFQKILEPKTCTGPPAIESNNMQNLTLSPGQKARFECRIDHSCLVSLIKWYHITFDNSTHTLIKTAKSPGDPHVYIIEKVNFQHEGIYSCVAENVIGKTEVIAILNINASPPCTALSLLVAAGCLAVSKYMAAHLSNSFI